MLEIYGGRSRRNVREDDLLGKELLPVLSTDQLAPFSYTNSTNFSIHILSALIHINKTERSGIELLSNFTETPSSLQEG